MYQHHFYTLTLLVLERKAPIPCYNSILTGDLYFQELMATENEAHFHSAAAKMEKKSFVRLFQLVSGPCGGLHSSRMISVGEKVMMFISLLCGYSNISMAERWKNSPSNVSAILHQATNVLLKKKMVDFLKFF